MPTLHITGLYLGLTIILALILGSRIGLYRAKMGISILDGGNMEVAQRMRVHGNFSETVALVLLSFAVIEINGASVLLLHCLGIGYLLSRIAHAIGLKHDNIRHPLRTVGAGGTMLVLLISGGVALWQFVHAG